MTETILSVKNIHKHYGKKQILRDVTLQMERGSILGFLGPNGAGKTTLIRIILGLVRPDRGSVVINGFPLQERFASAIRGVGSVVEIPRFYPYLNAYQNLQLACNLHPKSQNRDIGDVLELVGLASRGKDKVGTYSLGMKQRLGLARALVTNPSLVFLDEPMNGLDPQGMIETRALIRRLQQDEGVSFFITSHLLSEVEQICDRIAIIHNGEITTQGSLAQLLEQSVEVVDVYTDDVPAAVAVLSQAEVAQTVTVSHNRITVEINLGDSPWLNRHLWEHGVPVRYLVPKKTSLEELFMELTGGGCDERTD